LLEKRLKNLSSENESITPDISICIGNGNFICIEVELVQKELSRVQRKIEKYIAEDKIKRVIYICANGAIRHLVTNLDPSLKVISLPIFPTEKTIQAIYNIIKDAKNA
jgi:hypothetical protein